MKLNKEKLQVPDIKCQVQGVTENTIKEMVQIVETHQWAIKDLWKLCNIIKGIIHTSEA